MGVETETLMHDTGLVNAMLLLCNMPVELD